MYRPLPPNYDEQNREQSVSVRIYQELKRKILDAEYKPGARTDRGIGVTSASAAKQGNSTAEQDNNENNHNCNPTTCN